MEDNQTPFNWLRYCATRQAMPVAYPTHRTQDGVEPLDWNSLGDTDQQRSQAFSDNYMKHFPATENPTRAWGDALSAAQSSPRSQLAWSEAQKQAHIYFQQYLAYLNGIDPKKASEELKKYRKNPSMIIEDALTAMGYRWDENHVKAHGERVHQQTIDSFFEPTDDPKEIELRKKVVIDHRDRAVENIRKQIQEWAEDTMYDYDISASTMTQLLRTANVLNIDNGLFAERFPDPPLPGLPTAKQLQAKAQNCRNLVKSVNIGQGKLWSQPNSIFPNGLPITLEEVLEPLGFSFQHHDISAHERFQPHLPYKSSKKAQDTTPEELAIINENHQKNLQKAVPFLRRALREGEYDVQGLFKFKHGNKGDYGNSFIDRMINYIFRGICRNNHQEFKNLILEADPDFPIKEKWEDSAGKMVPDEKFEGFNAYARSNEEAKCLQVLRDSFGIMATPYELEIPTHPECATNPSCFKIDFVIPCTILSRWREGEDGIVHPALDDNVAFVGEYFGFNRKQSETLDEDHFLPDGTTIAKGVDDDGNEIDMRQGAKVQKGSVYKLRSEWKRMMETFTAHTLGTRSIFIESKNGRIDPVQIMHELDRNNILYDPKPPAQCQEDTCVIEKALEAHLPYCKDPWCMARDYMKKTVNPQTGKEQYKPDLWTPTVQEAWVRAAMMDVKVNYGLRPILDKATRHSTTPITANAIWENYTGLDRLQAQRNQMQQEHYAALRHNDEGKKMQTAIALRNIDAAIAARTQAQLPSLMNEYTQHMKRHNTEYRTRLDALGKLLHHIQLAADGGAEPLSDDQVRLECRRYTSKGDYAGDVSSAEHTPVAKS